LIAVKRNVDHLNKVMRNYRDQKEAILKSTLEPEVKRQLIDQLDSSINKTLEVIPILRRAAFAEEKQAR
jgi:L-fucose mutarotase/ribose pyranase (RbsD/FucU family)